MVMGRQSPARDVPFNERAEKYPELGATCADYIFSVKGDVLTGTDYIVTRGDNGNRFGSGDDAGALLNDIIADVGSSYSAHVYFKNGWYKLDTKVDVDIGLHLEGTLSTVHDDVPSRMCGSCLYADKASLLTDHLIEFTNPGTPDTGLAIIENLGFSERGMGGATTANKAFLKIGDFGDATFRNCIMRGVKHCFGLLMGNHGSWIYNNDFEDHAANAGSPAMLYVSANRNFLHNNYFARNFRGLKFYTADTQFVSDCRFIDNTMNDIVIEGSRYFTIHDCIFKSWNQGAGTKYSIDLYWGEALNSYAKIHDCLWDGDESGADPANYDCIGDSGSNADFVDIHDCRAINMDVTKSLNALGVNANGNVHDNNG